MYGKVLLKTAKQYYHIVRSRTREAQRYLCRAVFRLGARNMRNIAFSKWQGTGNDFIVIDDRDGMFPASDIALVRHLCDRHVGIGSDGLILVQASRVESMAYHMEFFNPDGSRSFCGNGSRCAFAFYSTLLAHGFPKRALSFTAIDGEHEAAWAEEQVGVSMRDVLSIERIDDHIDFLHTGSPHLVCWVDDPGSIDIITEAHVHRYSERFAKAGINVNFVRWHDGRLEMRTYERGVEAETLSCGTGVTAAALSAMSHGSGAEACDVHTRGGDLRVLASSDGSGGYNSITLTGPVREVFNGVVSI